MIDVDIMIQVYKKRNWEINGRKYIIKDALSSEGKRS